MGLITLPNVRATSDITVRLRLKDGGLAIDWSTLSNIRVWIYSDAQRAMAGRCETIIDADDNTILVCDYSANKPQYLGINSIVVRATYHGRTKTYDKKFAVIVPRTDDVSGDTVLEDPVVDLDLEVEDVSSSILDTIVAACVKVTEEAKDIVDVHRGPQGESAYEVAVDNGFIGTEQEWLASLQGEDGTPGTPGTDGSDGADGESAYQIAVDNGFVGTETEWLASLQGEDGEPGPEGPEGPPGQNGEDGADGVTPSFSIGTVTTGAAGSSAQASVTGTPANPVLNLTIPQGIQGNTGSSVDYPYELVNNDTTNDATKGASAAVAYALGQEIDQLDSRLFELGGYLVSLLKKVAYKDDDAAVLIDAIESVLIDEELLSITAVYTQPGTIYEGQPLEDLKDGLVVTANYISGRTVEVTTYTLSGTLAAGTSTITVTYQEMTATFNVIVTDAVWYRADGVGDGVGIAYQVAPRAAFTSSNRANAATINGVVYYFTQAGTAVSAAKKRSLYYLFDLLLTAGKTYKFEFYVTGLASGQQIFVGLPYYSETFRAAGVANSSSAPQDYNDQVTDTGWLTPTNNNGVLEVTYVTPASRVGTRINLKVQSGGEDINWPSDLRFTRFAIREVTE